MLSMYYMRPLPDNQENPQMKENARKNQNFRNISCCIANKQCRCFHCGNLKSAELNLNKFTEKHHRLNYKTKNNIPLLLKRYENELNENYYYAIMTKEWLVEQCSHQI